MNKNIKELAGQAGLVFSGDRGLLHWMGSKTESITHAELSKFAELIVDECMEINKQELSFAAFERLINKYKEHFGVEE